MFVQLCAMLVSLKHLSVRKLDKTFMGSVTIQRLRTTGLTKIKKDLSTSRLASHTLVNALKGETHSMH